MNIHDKSVSLLVETATACVVIVQWLTLSIKLAYWFMCSVISRQVTAKLIY